MSDSVTFSFGKNWQSFLKSATQDDLIRAQQDVQNWMSTECIAGKIVLDIGCGSGIHSLAFLSLGAKRVVSFDFDRYSVGATRSLWERTGKPSNWSIQHGSVLDERFMSELGVGSFDVVYAWGVLHHTGAMWNAIAMAGRMVTVGGSFWLALYAKGPNYSLDLGRKQRYNAASWLGKKFRVLRWILNLMSQRIHEGKNPFTWNERTGRGMNTYHDIVDWLGGLPYEVATVEEVDLFLVPKGFVRTKTAISPEGGNHTMVYSRTGA